MSSNKIQLLGPTRNRLAQIARKEAESGFRGEKEMAGPEIERYLSVFRQALNLNGSTDQYSDKRMGYDWCGAFVYYCCLKAGFNIAAKPIPTYRYTLAAVPAWQNWAYIKRIYIEHGKNAEIGDIVLYNNVYNDVPLDHMGIVIEVSVNSILSAEGNNDNRTGLFNRSYERIAGYVRLPKNDEVL